jgi:hypothetical protein
VVLPYTDFPQLLGLLLRLLNGELAWAMRREVLKVSQRHMRADRASSSHDSKGFEGQTSVVYEIPTWPIDLADRERLHGPFVCHRTAGAPEIDLLM